MSLAMLFELHGVDAKVARDGIQAVRLAAEYRPDIVLMDLSMPHMNGYEAARAIRQESWGTRMVLVALTGWGRPDDLRSTRAAGFDGHLLKPVDPGTLFATLQELHDRKASHGA